MKSTIYSVAALFLSVLSLSADVPDGWPASHPAWWAERGVVDHTDEPGNTSPINQGQLLHMAEQGIAELDEQLAIVGGAGFTVSGLIDQAVPNYYAPANLGQLKNVSSKFYERFEDVGFDAEQVGWPTDMELETNTGYPWPQNQTAANYRPALIGQAKHLFSWDLEIFVALDTDADLMPDWWEYFYTQSRTAFNPFIDADDDKLTNVQEWSLGTNPTSSVSLDADSIPDDWELYYGLDTTVGVDDSSLDLEPDGLMNSSEFLAGTDPNRRDHPDLKLILF